MQSVGKDHPPFRVRAQYFYSFSGSGFIISPGRYALRPGIFSTIGTTAVRYLPAIPFSRLRKTRPVPPPRPPYPFSFHPFCPIYFCEKSCRNQMTRLSRQLSCQLFFRQRRWFEKPPLRNMFCTAISGSCAEPCLLPKSRPIPISASSLAPNDLNSTPLISPLNFSTASIINVGVSNACRLILLNCEQNIPLQT